MLQKGYILHDNCKIIEPIGAEEQGKIYLAENILLDFKVTVKSLERRAGMKKYDQFRQQFEREARIGLKLTHSNIVRVYELVRKDYDLYLVTEYAEKGTLADRLKAAGSLPVGEALDISIAICRALNYAHKRNLVHGDVRPGNIFLVVDKDIGDEHIVYKLSGFGEMLEKLDESCFPDTWLYASPERVKGERFDERADIYSLGGVLCEMLTGTPPFPLMGHSKDALTRVARDHLEKPVASPKQKCLGLCEEVNQIVLKMLEKKPADRYENATQLLEVLQTAREVQRNWEKELERRYKEAIRLSDEKDWQSTIDELERLLADKAPYNDLQQRLDDAKRRIRRPEIFDAARKRIAEAAIPILLVVLTTGGGWAAPELLPPFMAPLEWWEKLWFILALWGTLLPLYFYFHLRKGPEED